MNPPSHRVPWTEALLLLALLAAAVSLRWWAFETGRTDFDSDEAVAALMAIDIWRDGATPIFFTGQNYGGSAESYLVAIVFALRGTADVVGVRLTCVLLMIASLMVTYGWIRWSTRRATPALIALAVLVFTSGFAAQWSVKLRGGYLLLSIDVVTILWAVMALRERSGPANRHERTLAALLGFALGFGWWNHRACLFAIAAIAVWTVASWLMEKPWRNASSQVLAHPSAVGQWRRSRGPVLAVLVALLFTTLDQGINCAATAPMPIATLCRVGPLALACLALVLFAEWTASYGRRGLWAIGTIALLAGYAPVIVFRAAGGATQVPFELARPDQMLGNLWSLLISMTPILFGIETADPVAQEIIVDALIVVALIAGLAGAALRTRRNSTDSRERSFLALSALLAVAACAALIANFWTAVVRQDPRHLLLVVLAVGALVGVGWPVVFRRLPILIFLVGLLAINSLTSHVALPGRDLTARGIPKDDLPLIELLEARGVRGCYVMDNQPSRGYWDAIRWTFHTGGEIAFAPPSPFERFPKHSARAAAQTPGCWVTRFPADVVHSYASRLRGPVEIIDVGRQRVAFTDDTDGLKRLVYDLELEPWADEFGKRLD